MLFNYLIAIYYINKDIMIQYTIDKKTDTKGTKHERIANKTEKYKNKCLIYRGIQDNMVLQTDLV